MCHLHKSLYGFKQASRAWYTELQLFLVATSFVNSHLGTSLFVYNTKDLVLYLLVCVNDFILIGNDLGFINKFFLNLPHDSPLRTLAHCLSSLELRWSHLKMVFLSQQKYITKLLTPTNMMNAKEV